MMAEPKPTRGYASAAPAYVGNGWQPFPLPAGRKSPPPTGYTGANGRSPTVGDVTRWCSSNPHGNIGLHLDPTIVGVDVDDYEGKEGGATLSALEQTHGALPPTWSSTSRGEGVSRISFYRIPAGVTFPGVLGSGIDVIQAHHRYAVVAPSTHPDSGERYRWYTPEGAVATAPPHIDELPGLPSAWVEALRWREPAELAPAKQSHAPVRSAVGADDSIAERIAHEHHWHDVLHTDGWQLAGTKTAETTWTRPGKDPRSGISAVLHEPDGPLNVFSTSVAALQQPWAERQAGQLWAFSLFGYLAATRYHGDRSACARDYRLQANAVDAQLRTLQTATAAVAVLDGQPEEDHDALAHLVDWTAFWAQDKTDEDWLAYPLVPRGRALALYAPAKAGKSSVVLALVAALAAGRPIFGRTVAAQAHVLYLDYEMTDSDLMERLVELGYGPGDDLGHLHYALLPSLPPLDTAAGAKAVVELAARVGADLVVVDTFGRAVEGDENEADTVRAFYRHTGLALKAAGRAVIRTDHAGKDVDKGQRGSSAKADDVDIVWQLRRTDHGVALKRTHSRLSWVPDEVALDRRLDPDGGVSWLIADGGGYPDGTGEVARLLEQLGVPATASARSAAATLREAGHGARNVIIRAAQRYRQSGTMPTEREHQQISARTESGQNLTEPTQKARPDLRGAVSGEESGAPRPDIGARSANSLVDERARSGARWGAVDFPEWGAAPHSLEGAPPGAPLQDEANEGDHLDPAAGLF